MECEKCNVTNGMWQTQYEKKIQMTMLHLLYVVDITNAILHT